MPCVNRSESRLSKQRLLKQLRDRSAVVAPRLVAAPLTRSLSVCRQRGTLDRNCRRQSAAEMVRRVRIGAIAALVALAGPLGAAAAAETVELSARMRVLASTEPGHTDTFCARAFQTAPPPAIKVNGLDAQVTNITGVEGRCSLEPHCQQAQSVRGSRFAVSRVLSRRA